MSDSRVAQLEFVVAHLQKTIDELNQVVVHQQKQLDSLQRSIDQNRHVVRTLMDADAVPRTAADDKPPHY